MAGEWLKMRHDLQDDPDVIRIAAECRIDEDYVVGKLHRVWSWVDRHTVDGVVEGIGMWWVDRMSRLEGFGAALVRVGWLEETGSGLRFPRFDRHCSDTAKSRAMDARRKAGKRDVRVTPGQNPDRRPGASRTESGPEKRRGEVPPPPREASPGDAGDPWPAFRKAWNDGAASGNRREWKPDHPPGEWADRIASVGWLERAIEAARRLRGCRYFTTPVPLTQFCGEKFVDLCLGGQYDGPKTPKGGGTGGDVLKASAEELAEKWRRGVDAQAESVARYVEARQRRGT